MSLILVIALLIASGTLALRRGPGAVFTYIYLPTLLLLEGVPAVSIEPLPDLNPLSAVSLATFVGTLLRAKPLPIRFHWVDGLVLACSLSFALTSYLTGTTWTLITFSGNDVLRYLFPYVMARSAFFDVDLRRHCCLVLCYVATFLAAAGLIEFRLQPLFVSRFLLDLGLSAVNSTMVLHRGAFFRAMVTTEHPIDYGNVGMILCGLIAALAITTGIGLRDRRVLIGLGAAAACVLFSMSFSSILGFCVAVGLYLALRYVRGTEYLLVPGMIATIVAGLLFTQHMINTDLAELRRETAAKSRDAGASAVDDSYTVRVLIAQNAYNRVGIDAGTFGFGDQTLTKADLGLQSVDNSYMLFLLRRGWSGLLLRLVLGVGIAALGTQMLAGERGEAARAPAAAIVAVLIGTMAAMFTVWFGFCYALLWTAALATLVSMRHVMLARRRDAALSAYDGRGFAVAAAPAARRPIVGAAARAVPF